MKEFKDLQNIWSEDEKRSSLKVKALDQAKNNRLDFLKKQFKISALGTFCVALFFIWFTFFSNTNLNFELSYIALILITSCVIITVLINVYNVYLINQINETLEPKAYLQQWFNFYQKRFRFYKFYGPLILLLFCTSFSFYIPEILGYYPNINYRVGFIIFTVFIFVGIFFLGNKNTDQEKKKLQEIKKNMEMLFKEEEVQ